MLELLLDENISPVVAEQTRLRYPEINIQSVRHWRAGALLNCPDDLVLQAAAEDGLTLITYDQTTIRPLLSEWSTEGQVHAGVIFVSERTVRSSDFGGLIRAIVRPWMRAHQDIWTNRIHFLERP
jgi:hypothetical protein